MIDKQSSDIYKRVSEMQSENFVFETFKIFTEEQKEIEDFFRVLKPDHCRILPRIKNVNSKINEFREKYKNMITKIIDF